ncbi:hypothetical protein AGR13a_Lc90299 [Agrobacterium genomosp. 13 str. CFBP 6927]|uniref:Uncharacterized protein n=1 Tax=Agrobacterium genomosp. 13 str. CFBP 6927 TaxID=1183428 RepID=A0ABM9VNP9_9HYPH|nr:hypothetical protein AGR13a_Lc90299 [Agrobacterium genomosp. 13 str. CFBP 6927]
MVSRYLKSHAINYITQNLLRIKSLSLGGEYVGFSEIDRCCGCFCRGDFRCCRFSGRRCG